MNKKAKIEDNYENLEETRSFYFKFIQGIIEKISIVSKKF